MLSINPNLTADGVRNVIARTCDKVGGYAYDSVFANGTWCRELGYGRVNAYRAVLYASVYNAVEEVHAEAQLNIFPNPSTNLVNIQYDGAENCIMKLYNINGSIVARQELHKGLNTADISFLSAGVYLARIETTSGAVTRKLVVCR